MAKLKITIGAWENISDIKRTLKTLILQLIVINKLLKIYCTGKLIASIDSAGKIIEETSITFLKSFFVCAKKLNDMDYWNPQSSILQLIVINKLLKFSSTINL